MLAHQIIPQRESTAARPVQVENKTLTAVRQTFDPPRAMCLDKAGKRQAEMSNGIAEGYLGWQKAVNFKAKGKVTCGEIGINPSHRYSRALCACIRMACYVRRMAIGALRALMLKCVGAAILVPTRLRLHRRGRALQVVR